jgi:hypothetical protein
LEKIRVKVCYNFLNLENILFFARIWYMKSKYSIKYLNQINSN